MLIIKITPTWFDTYNFLLILMVFWWFCRLCSTMKTLCDSDGCYCDLVGKITCVCHYPNQVRLCLHLANEPFQLRFLSFYIAAHTHTKRKEISSRLQYVKYTTRLT